MLSIGWRMLKRDRLRMSVAVCGVAFAVLLVTALGGMLLGLTRGASLLVDRTRADLLVSVPELKTFDFAAPMARRKKHLIASVPGVERVEEYNIVPTMWKLPSGGDATCQIVAFEPRGQLGPSLELVAGDLAELNNTDGVILDESGRKALGYPALGSAVEIVGLRARVVGFTRGMQSFTTIPFVFTALKQGARYGFLDHSPIGKDAQSVYFLVRTATGASPQAVARAIEARVTGVEVHSREELSRRTRYYWLVETGIGMAFFGAGVLGLLVGAVIVSQTLYGMTLERLPEFGVLKALGASPLELSWVVLEQGLACGVLGLFLGLLCGYGVSLAAAGAGTIIEIPGALAMGVAALALGLAGGGSLLSILRLRWIEPVMVFRA